MLFVYGTLQDPDVLSAVLGRAIDMQGLRPAVAPGFRAVAYPGRVYPALVPAAGDAAPGRVIEGLDETDLSCLDAFEGTEYRRSMLDVLIENRAFRASAYLPVIDIDAGTPVWSLDEWTLLHKPTVIGGETETAIAIRTRLSAQQPK